MLSEVLIGVMLSQGLGEAKAAPYLETRTHVRSLRLSAQGEWSRKVESRQGYRLGADAEWYGPLILSASYRYRDGGSWVKQGAWVGAGIGTTRNRLMLRHELQHNRTWAIGSTVSYKRLEAQASVYSYRNESGRHPGATLLVGVRL